MIFAYGQTGTGKTTYRSTRQSHSSYMLRSCSYMLRSCVRCCCRVLHPRGFDSRRGRTMFGFPESLTSETEDPGWGLLPRAVGSAHCAQYFALLRALMEPGERRLYLVARGLLRALCTLIEAEARRVSDAEEEPRGAARVASVQIVRD